MTNFELTIAGIALVVGLLLKMVLAALVYLLVRRCARSVARVWRLAAERRAARRRRSGRYVQTRPGHVSDRQVLR